MSCRYAANDTPEERSMRISAFVALMLMAVTTSAPRPAAAAYNLPWCATYYDSLAKSCAFTSFEQCMATVRGVGGHCTQNLLFPAEPPYAERRRAKSRVAGDH
jgi:Protein of unknown function (DUF3551)